MFETMKIFWCFFSFQKWEDFFLGFFCRWVFMLLNWIGMRVVALVFGFSLYFRKNTNFDAFYQKLFACIEIYSTRGYQNVSQIFLQSLKFLTKAFICYCVVYGKNSIHLKIGDFWISVYFKQPEFTDQPTPKKIFQTSPLVPSKDSGSCVAYAFSGGFNYALKH